MTAPIIPAKPPEQAFEAPWHAQVFAMTVALNAAGCLPWEEWTQALGAALRRQSGGESPAETYYLAWSDALVRCLARNQIVEDRDLSQMIDAWRQGYLSTPHGQPVTPAPLAGASKT